MRKWISRILVNRLRMKRDFAAHPEIADIALRPPVIISCIPRTGSTKLLKSLAATGDFNFTPLWIMLNPSSITGVPLEPASPRIAASDRFVAWMNQSSPHTRNTHEMSTHEPEEDAFIMGHSLCSPMMNAFAYCPSYLKWYARQDHSVQFAYDRDVLKYLIWQGLAEPDKPFVLKSAFNSGSEKFIFEAFPNANIVIPHRHPAQSIPSLCRLSLALRGAFSDQYFDQSAIPSIMALLKKKEMAFRRNNPGQMILDTAYHEIEVCAPKVVEQIYEFCGLPLGSKAAHNVHQCQVDNAKNKPGSSHYTCEEFGFSAENINEAFAEYLDAYGMFLQ